MSDFDFFLSQGGLQIGYRWGKKYESGEGEKRSKELGKWQMSKSQIQMPFKCKRLHIYNKLPSKN